MIAVIEEELEKPVAPNGQFHQLAIGILRACGERELQRQPDLFAHWKCFRSTI